MLMMLMKMIFFFFLFCCCFVVTFSAASAVKSAVHALVRPTYLCQYRYNWTSVCDNKSSSSSSSNTTTKQFCSDRCRYLGPPSNFVMFMTGNSYLRQVLEAWFWEINQHTSSSSYSCANKSSGETPHIVEMWYHPYEKNPSFLNGTLFHHNSFTTTPKKCNLSGKEYCTTDLVAVTFSNQAKIFASFNHELNVGLYQKEPHRAFLALQTTLLFFGVKLQHVDAIVINPGNDWAISWIANMFGATEARRYLHQHNIVGLAAELHRANYRGLYFTATYSYTNSHGNKSATATPILPSTATTPTFKHIDMPLLVHPQSRWCAVPDCADKPEHQCIPGLPVETAQWLRYHLWQLKKNKG